MCVTERELFGLQLEKEVGNAHIGRHCVLYISRAINIHRPLN